MLLGREALGRSALGRPAVVAEAPAPAPAPAVVAGGYAETLFERARRRHRREREEDKRRQEEDDIEPFVEAPRRMRGPIDPSKLIGKTSTPDVSPIEIKARLASKRRRREEEELLLL